MKKEKTLKSMLLKNNNYKKENLIEACKKSKETIQEISNKKKKENYIELFSNGNKKLEKNIKIIDIVEKSTCPCICDSCYSTKQLFTTKKNKRLRNLIYFIYAIKNKNFRKNFLENCKHEFNEHANTYKHAICRLHSSGDFFSLDYFYLILKMIYQNQNIFFYTYTKNMLVYKIYEKIKNKIKNFHIVNSFFYNHFNYFDIREELNTLDKLLNKASKENKKIFFCLYSIEKHKKEVQQDFFNILDKYRKNVFYNKTNKHVTCGACMGCMNKNFDNVLLIKH